MDMTATTVPQRYCLGFIFTPDLDRVLMLLKEPTLHRDKWNGIGGKLEGDESAIAAMVRECKEELGQDIPADEWTFLGYIRGPADHRWEVSVYATRQNVKAWLADAGPEPAMLIRRIELVEYPLAPHTEVFVARAMGGWRAEAPVEHLVVFDAGSPYV